MKTTLLMAIGVLGGLLAGCESNKEQATETTGQTGEGSPGFEYDTTAGRGMGYQNDLGPNDPRGAFQQWRFGADPDRIPPRSPVNPNRPEEIPHVPLPDEEP